MMRIPGSALRLTGLRSAVATLVTAALMLPSLSGCAPFVQLFGALQVAAVEPAKYKNLGAQSVAVMVWCEEGGVRVEWPRIHLDLAQMIQSKFQNFQKSDKPEELKLTRFPVSPASIARYQEEHPELAGVSITDIAPKLGVTRLIYVELHSFQTRPDNANDLFRGTVSGSVRVIEVVNGIGKETYSDDNIRVTYPNKTPDEGLPNIGDFPIYNGTLDGFATEVLRRFVPHGNDPDAEYATNAPRAD